MGIKTRYRLVFGPTRTASIRNELHGPFQWNYAQPADAIRSKRLPKTIVFAGVVAVVNRSSQSNYRTESKWTNSLPNSGVTSDSLRTKRVGEHANWSRGSRGRNFDGSMLTPKNRASRDRPSQRDYEWEKFSMYINETFGDYLRIQPKKKATVGVLKKDPAENIVSIPNPGGRLTETG